MGGTGVFCSEQKKEQVVDFFSTHKVAASGVSLQRAQDAIDDCVQLRAAQGPKLEHWAGEQGVMGHSEGGDRGDSPAGRRLRSLR
ncbi:MAG TPA: hypothetical protein VHX13_05775 [Acidobacteriaceae bacterium]|nr:hypothetical protein [Acidobacteriaceae bacterium]